MDPNFWVPDKVITKHDPYDLISSNFGQQAGQYNWNADQFNLMNRTRRTCDGCTRGGLDVATVNLTLFVNDQEYFIKGMCYTPVPLGIYYTQQGQGGGGLCSPRQNAYGQVNSGCDRGSDTDYFRGDIAPGRTPPGPTNGWFTSLWERDFPVIKASGANTVRMYYAGPITKQYTDGVLNGTITPIDGDDPIVAPSNGADHTVFMDTAYRHGLMVIFPLMGDQTAVSMYTDTRIQSYIMNLIDEIGNHPALLMYTLGNEWNVENDATLLQKVNNYMGFARNYSLSRWGRRIPICHVLLDDPFEYDRMYASLDQDIFCTNAGYRGMGFSDLWDGSQTPGFSGLGPLSVKYNIPNFVSEMGWMQLNGTQTSSPQNNGWFNVKWRDLINKGTVAGCSGGAFFEYIDEIYTKADPLEQTQGIVSSLPTTLADLSSTTGVPGPEPSLTWKYGSQQTGSGATIVTVSGSGNSPSKTMTFVPTGAASSNAIIGMITLLSLYWLL